MEMTPILCVISSGKPRTATSYHYYALSCLLHGKELEEWGGKCRQDGFRVYIIFCNEVYSMIDDDHDDLLHSRRPLCEPPRALLRDRLFKCKEERILTAQRSAYTWNHAGKGKGVEAGLVVCLWNKPTKPHLRRKATTFQTLYLSYLYFA